MIQYTVESIIAILREYDAFKVDVNLHMHYDKGDGFDYSGEHAIHVTIFESRQKAMSFAPVGQDLTNLSLEECETIHYDVYEELAKYHPKTYKQTFIHP